MRQYTEILVRENTEMQQQCHQLKQLNKTNNQEQSEIQNLKSQVQALQQQLLAYEQMELCSDQCTLRQEQVIRSQQQQNEGLKLLLERHQSEIQAIVKEKELLIQQGIHLKKLVSETTHKNEMLKSDVELFHGKFQACEVELKSVNYRFEALEHQLSSQMQSASEQQTTNHKLMKQLHSL